ncbi:MAG: hypothetical protein EAZ70_01985 [Runella slithyformis]|nr:MAG: hypothetical protein EAZ70_01985 [Runella slithyformis]TAF48226.1 MAG: hypothetical protein EAZ63_06055 [Runella slithyformis]TAH15950.1 MAG: hypothetical protein EAZ14_01205 [Runella slithyformis]
MRSLKLIFRTAKIAEGKRRKYLVTFQSIDLRFKSRSCISPLQAKLMVRYREQHGAYPNAQELLKIKILDQKFVDKITPYLEF